MKVDRRSAFKILGVGCAGAAAVRMGHARINSEAVAPLPDAVGLLYDATRCVGCKACVSACSEANGLPPETGESGGLYQAPDSLSAQTKNIIKVYEGPGGEWSFMKQQCMHCIDPACVVACPLSALYKDEELGIVSWNGKTCLGCRCCQIACPYNIPKFEWTKINPRVVKCEMCRHLLARGGRPACTTACPRAAVIFGKREDLLKDAHDRIRRHPGRYYLDRVYGETEGGGTQVLYLSHVAFSKLGLPELDKDSIASGVRGVQEKIYQHGAAPIIFYSAMVAITKRLWGRQRQHSENEAEELGLKDQM